MRTLQSSIEIEIAMSENTISERWVSQAGGEGAAAKGKAGAAPSPPAAPGAQACHCAGRRTVYGVRHAVGQDGVEPWDTVVLAIVPGSANAAATGAVRAVVARVGFRERLC